MAPIRFIHFADYHLGMENFGRLNPKTGLHTRAEDYLNVLDWLVGIAIEKECHAVIFAGDAFKTREPNQTYAREFAKRIKRLVDNKIAVLLLVGNHDSHSSDKKATTMTIYDTLGIEGVFVADKPEIIELKLKNQEKLQILTLPWLYKNRLLSGQNTAKLSQKEREELLSQKFSQIFSSLKEQLEQNKTTIAAIHATVSGASFGAERMVLLGDDLILNKELLRDSRFKYIALGHIHRHQVLNQNPPIIYPGSLERLDFSEENDQKGCILVEINDKKTSWEFLKSPARTFKTIELEIESIGDLHQGLEKQAMEAKNAITRVILKGPKELLDHISDKEISERLTETHYLCPIIHQYTDLNSKERRKSIDTDKSPLEALDLYAKIMEIPKDRSNKLKKLMQELMTYEDSN